jgi:hypothetical protein
MRARSIEYYANGKTFLYIEIGREKDIVHLLVEIIGLCSLPLSW